VREVSLPVRHGSHPAGEAAQHVEKGEVRGWNSCSEMDTIKLVAGFAARHCHRIGGSIDGLKTNERRCRWLTLAALDEKDLLSSWQQTQFQIPPIPM